MDGWMDGWGSLSCLGGGATPVTLDACHAEARLLTRCNEKREGQRATAQGDPKQVRSQKAGFLCCASRRVVIQS